MVNLLYACLDTIFIVKPFQTVYNLVNRYSWKFRWSFSVHSFCLRNPFVDTSKCFTIALYSSNVTQFFSCASLFWWVAQCKLGLGECLFLLFGPRFSRRRCLLDRSVLFYNIANLFLDIRGKLSYF